jgi:virginiamycin B lyase
MTSFTRIDPSTNEVVKIFPVGRRPCSGLAVGLGAVWLPSCGDSKIDRGNDQSISVEAHIPTPIADSEGGIATGNGAADRRGKLVRINASVNEIDAQVQGASGSYVPAIGGGAVWISSTDHLVTRVVDRSRRRGKFPSPSTSIKANSKSDQMTKTSDSGNGAVPNFIA